MFIQVWREIYKKSKNKIPRHNKVFAIHKGKMQKLV